MDLEQDLIFFSIKYGITDDFIVENDLTTEEIYELVKRLEEDYLQRKEIDRIVLQVAISNVLSEEEDMSILDIYNSETSENKESKYVMTEEEKYEYAEKLKEMYM